MKNILPIFALFMFFSANVEAQCTGTNPIISQVAEGSSNNKTVEIYNPSNSTLDLSGFVLERVANGNGAGSGSNISLSGMLASGGVFVISNPSAESAILNISDQTSGTISHNGNDSYILKTTGGVTIDSYGDANSSSSFGSNMNMQRVLSGACPYDTDPEDAFDASAYVSSSYTTGLPPGLGDAIGGLPVQLVSFRSDLAGSKVSLTWETASEQNNDYFSIEHSNNGIDYKEIGQTKGNGTTAAAQNYSFVHANPTQGINYYRLKQIDFDGTYAYSGVQVIEIKKEGNIRVFPSQVFEIINIDLATVTKEEIIIGVFNLMGKMVTSKVLAAETTQTQLNVSNLTNGHYFIQVQIGNEKYTERFVKMK